MHMTALPNCSGTWSTCTALLRSQLSNLGVIASEQTRIIAVSMLGLRHYEPHFDWWIFALSPGIAVIDQLLRRYRRSEATTHLASRSGRARLRADRRRRQHTGQVQGRDVTVKARSGSRSAPAPRSSSPTILYASRASNLLAPD